MPELYFEDFELGRVYELGSVDVTEADILEFARRFDPQPFHVDPEAARQSVFGGLIASGWHTGAMWMRLYVDSLLDGAASMGSPGIEELRWLAPVRPGDTLDEIEARHRLDEARSADDHRNSPGAISETPQLTTPRSGLLSLLG